MKQAFLTVSLAVLLLTGCKSTRKENIPSDAKPRLYVSHEDDRYVGEEDAGRQVQYYSASRNRSYVIDENSGKVLKTFDQKDFPKTVIVADTAMPTEEVVEEAGCGAACGCGEEAGCGAACGCGEEVVEEAGCGEAACGCGVPCGDGCGDGCGCGS